MAANFALGSLGGVGNLGEVTILGALNVVLQQSNMIGGIQVDTTIDESYEDSLEITEHPVEAGAAITDHCFKRPMELVLSCGWSDSSASGLFGVASSVLQAVSPVAAGIVGIATAASSFLSNPGAGNSGSFAGGSMAASDYVAGIYSQLLQLQQSRKPFEVISGLRVYDNMLLQSIRVRRDQRSQYTLNVQAVMREVIIVSTQTATLAPQANQANPASTADTTNVGQQQLQSSSNVSPLTAVLPPQSQ